MGYVKISDPNLIDLNAIHNIINVINQHSDTLNTLTNNYGANNNSTVAAYSASDSVHAFDMGSQMIVYGRKTFNSSTSVTPNGSTGKLYHDTVSFTANGGPAFSVATPLVFLTLHIGNSASVNNTFADAHANIYNLTASSFQIRLVMNEAIGTGQSVFINWMAIGPKGK
jgi:hypothetical protein